MVWLFFPKCIFGTWKRSYYWWLLLRVDGDGVKVLKVGILNYPPTGVIRQY